MRTLVSLDLETTGLDSENDAILEVGIVKFRGEEILEEWSSVVNPRRPIPAKITELTGINDAMAATGIDLWSALGSTREIASNYPIIGHNIQFDLGFLRKQRVLDRNASIDTFELASILVPHAGRYSLGALATELGITLPATHRALDDARVAHQLYLKVFNRAVELPLETLEEIVQMADRSQWSLTDFWRDVQDAKQSGTFSTSIGAAIKKKVSAKNSGGKKETGGLSLMARRQAQLNAKALEPKENITELDVDAVARHLGDEGSFAKQFDHYEARPQQVDMLRKVTEAFNEDKNAFIEAGTGTGKSLAYLIPSMMWAIENGQRVVISTNTINLQEQLADKDVPAVIEMLGGAGRAAVMKGKARYVCPLRLKELRKNGPKSQDEARLLAKLIIWQPNTVTGDADEVFMPAPGERAAFQHISAANPSCNMNTCTATDCYFYQARRIAESAHIIIVNHALLLADIAVENRALPEYKRLIIDEGHHLESAATDSLTYRIDRDELGRALGDLGRSQQTPTRKATGLLADIASKARTSLAVDKSAAIENVCTQATQQVQNVYANTITFFDVLLDFFADDAGEKSDYTQRLRITKPLRNRANWSQIVMTCDNVVKEMNALTKSLDTLFRGMTELSEEMADFDALAGRLNGSIRFTTECSEQMNRMIVKPNDDYIYWAEIETRRNNTRLSLNAAPLRVGPMLEKHVWNEKDSVVLTSATMRTANSNSKAPSFDYIKDRLQAGEAETLAVGSPFDYKKSTLVYLVTDIPEPNQQGYQQWVEKGMALFYTASQGRGLGLFTSNAQLRMTSKAIAPELLKSGIIVYEQGDGSNRRAMVEQFKNADKAVLLGTKSFWEGVDIPGDRLSALAIVKLPFDVPTDPIFAARSETFTNSFNDFSVPETILKFRQGFGRLIRSKSDRGVVAIFDRRLLSKGYGNAFLSSLPEPTFVRGPMAGLAKATADWLAER